MNPMQTRHIVVARFAVSVLVVSFGHVRHSPAQTAARPDSHVCRGDKSLQGLPIRNVTIESRGGWQPVMHLPLPSNSIVLPLSARYTGRPLTRFTKAAVRDSGRALPPTVATSFTCVTMTLAGRMYSLIA